MKIAAIASMKRGLEQFIYRELCFLEQGGASIHLFATKARPGSYNPRPSWRVHSWSPWRVLLLQPYHACRAPRTYFRLLAHAIRMRAVIDFFVACDFAWAMPDVDVIYATFGDRKFFVGYFCKRLLNKPLAVTVHAYELYANPNPRLFQHALRACDQVITVSEHNREYLHEKYGLDPADVTIVRYSIDLEDYRPARKFVILIVAFFVERKGHEILLRAVQQLANEQLEIWVVGDEGVEAESVDVQGLVHELQLENQVAFFGRLSGTALRAVFHACDVFCLPCRVDRHGVAEGFPNVIIEAMAVGKPVITTRHVEIPRVLNELLVAENDVDALAQAIDQVYRSQSLRDRLGAANRQIAERVFSPRNAQRTASILEQLVARDGSVGPPCRPAGAAREDRVAALKV